MKDGYRLCCVTHITNDNIDNTNILTPVNKNMNIKQMNSSQNHSQQSFIVTVYDGIQVILVLRENPIIIVYSILFCA